MVTHLFLAILAVQSIGMSSGMYLTREVREENMMNSVNFYTAISLNEEAFRSRIFDVNVRAAYFE